jgi:hypothetical protein
MLVISAQRLGSYDPSKRVEMNYIDELVQVKSLEVASMFFESCSH